MLQEFTVGNYLSFKNPVTLDLSTAGITEYPENVFEAGKKKLLKGAVVYGANSSGKTNLLRAMSKMRHFVLNSSKRSSQDEIGVLPFLLNPETERSPSFFEVLFFLDGKRYRYGFEVSQEKVHGEWLFVKGGQKEKPLFVRELDGIEVMAGFSEGAGLEEKTRDNALFLSVADQFNGQISRSIMAWFRNWNTISGLRHEAYRAVTFNMLEDEKCKPLFTRFLKQLDLGFHAFQVVKEPFNPSRLPKNLPPEVLQQIMEDLKEQTMVSIETLHKVFDYEGNETGVKEFNLRTQESAGTNKIFNMLGPIFDTLLNGGVLVVDELGSSMHPLLTKAIVSLFNSNEHNPNNAQLIFATHDTNLLSYGNFRRDQIYFIEKDYYGASNLYSLVEYKEEGGSTVRKDRSFEKDYIQGRYGGIPFIGDFSKMMSEWQEKLKLTMPS
ncbi:MAG: ATP-binding protein [Lewinellaceae bacterium]|nr:ATP-binding protein [Lewinellaceae bacterium]